MLSCGIRAMPFFRALRQRTVHIKALPGNRVGSVALIFALSIVLPMAAAGTGVDLARALVVRARLAEALDAAGLAVGTANGLTAAQERTLAQNYFNANYTANASFATPIEVTVTPGTQTVTLSTSVAMPTTLMNVVGIKTLNVGYTSQVFGRVST